MPLSDIPSYQGLIDAAAELLHNSSDTPRIDAEVLLQAATQQSMAWLIARGNQLASSEHIKTFYGFAEQRQSGIPVAYIVGSRDFWTLTLKVDERVLIPRPDTETLVEHALEKLPANSPTRLLDLGAGSGAIALSLAKERPYSQVLAVDSELAALAVCGENAQLNNISNVEFLHSNWFDKIAVDTRFDLIAANPPYVEMGDPHLACGDLRFEPSTALVAADQGLADLRTIIETAPQYLKAHGWLIVEHGYNQAAAVKQLFSDQGFVDIKLHHDINQLPRCTMAWHHGHV